MYMYIYICICIYARTYIHTSFFFLRSCMSVLSSLFCFSESFPPDCFASPSEIVESNAGAPVGASPWSLSYS